MVTYRASKGREKGQWWPVTGEDRRTATLICPRCGGELVLRHEIDAEGVVYSSQNTSSVKCPYGCGFDVMLILEGWKEK